MKKIDELKHIPVVIFSTSDLSSTKSTALALGANAFYTKPSTHDKYETVMKEIFTNIIPPMDIKNQNS